MVTRGMGRNGNNRSSLASISGIGRSIIGSIIKGIKTVFFIITG